VIKEYGAMAECSAGGGELEHVLQCQDVTEDGTGDSALPALPDANDVGIDRVKCKADCRDV
jgi:hypothetical protein